MRSILGSLSGHHGPEDPPTSATAGGFAVLDFETTGLFPGGHDRVVELAVVHVSPSGQIQGEWETLVNPERDLGKQSIHRIRASDILDAPTFVQVAPQLVELLSGRVLVAHNASFDCGFLDGEFERIGSGPGTPVAAWCPMRLAADIIPGAGRSLADCCAHFEIDTTGAHRASVDARATAHLLGEYIRATPKESLWNNAVASARATWIPILTERSPWKPRPKQDLPQPHFLERIATRLPEHTGPGAEHDYLALLDRVLLDRAISSHEASDLVRLAADLDLDRTTCERLHLAYFRAVAETAWADTILTDTERAELAQLAQLLQIPQAELDIAVKSPAAEAPGAYMVEVAQVTLQAGDLVVLTGDMTRAREDWVADLESVGLVWINYINKKVRLLAAADPDTLSGKAAKARDYGIAIVNEDGLTHLITKLRTG